MKKFDVKALIAVSVLGLLFLFSACSGGGGGNDPPAAQPSTISNNTQGTQASSSAMQGSSVSQGAGQTFVNLGNVGLSSTAGAPEFKTSATFQPSPGMKKIIKTTGKFAKSRSANDAANSVRRAVSVMKSQVSNVPVSGSGTKNCTDGGSFTYNISAAGNNFIADITFSSCRDNDSQTDGLYHLTGTATQTGVATLNITLGTASTPFTLSDYSSGYAGLLTKSAMTAFSLGITEAADASSITMAMSASGSMSVKDFVSGDDCTFTFANNFSDTFSIAKGAANSAAPSSLSFSITTNGDFSESYTTASATNTVSVSFQNLKLDVGMYGLDVPETAYEQLDLNGQFSIAFNPASCMSGTFKLATSQPIRAWLSTDTYYQGVLSINDATTCTYNSNGTITVKTGAESKTYQDELGFFNECPIETFNGPTPAP